MKRSLPVILFLACAGLFVFGLLQLFRMRFEVGDNYPAYSSLRADPLGTMAFYESLGRVPGISVQRDYSIENRLPFEAGTAYLHIAAPARELRWMPVSLVDEIERFAKRGGRLVITLEPMQADFFQFGRWDPQVETNSPSSKPGSKTKAEPKPEEENDVEKENDKDTPEDSVHGDDEIPAKPKPKKKRKTTGHRDNIKIVSLAEAWKIGFEIRSLSPGENDVYDAIEVERVADISTPDSLVWHSGIVITNAGSDWKPIYVRGTNAVVVERNFGRGSVVIATDSYFLSNEAMQRDRHADFLAWLIGSSRKVVFDEAHLGVTEQPGMATLLRKYRLYWLIGALILLALLFVWKNAFSLAPPYADERTRGWIPGKDSASGFVNLLRRSIPPHELLASCFEQWNRSASSLRHSPTRRAAATAIFEAARALPEKKQNPVQVYREIHHALELKPGVLTTDKANVSGTTKTTT
jgi:hypothetical protein